MNHAATAAARHHTYLILSRLYLDGPTAELLAYIDEIPELAVAVTRPFDADEAAAAHYAIFAHDIFPYESIFRDPSGLLGGDCADQINAIYQRAGVQINAEPDHFGRETAFLASLCHAESKALGDGETEFVAYFRQQQAQFLQEHMLYWLSPFVTALSFSGQAFYATLGRLTQELVYDHVLALREEGSADYFGSPRVGIATDLSDIVQDNQTGLKQIARFLITPPYSGFFIGQGAISDFARRQQLPRGFGTRQQMLSNLLHSAAQYDLIPDLFQDLSSQAATWTVCYKEQILDFPELQQWIQPWRERTAKTARALAEMSVLSKASC